MPEEPPKVTSGKRRSSLGRALGLSVVMACFGSGALLSVLAFQSTRVDCAALSTEECTFAQQTGAGIARLQWLAALGVLLVGGGALVWLRER